MDAEKEDTGGALDFLTMRTVNMESREAAGSEAGEVTPSHSQQTRNTLHLVENTLQQLQVANSHSSSHHLLLHDL